MPLYEIHYTVALTASQKDALADALTTLHSTTFTTPRNFVNVSFHDAALSETYIGGKTSRANHIRAFVRAGPTRRKEEWDQLCEKIEEAWKHIVIENPTPRPKGRGLGEEEMELRSVVMMGGILAGREAGFALPGAGEDVDWLQGHWGEFERLAGQGKREWVELVQDVKKRGLLDGTGGQKTAQQQLEDMLGWGDSA